MKTKKKNLLSIFSSLKKVFHFFLFLLRENSIQLKEEHEPTTTKNVSNFSNLLEK